MNKTLSDPGAELVAPGNGATADAAANTEYVQDVPYTWSFFRYQSPLLMNYAAALNGFAAPALDRGFSYCDLGCGNGVTVNLLARRLSPGPVRRRRFQPRAYRQRPCLCRGRRHRECRVRWRIIRRLLRRRSAGLRPYGDAWRLQLGWGGCARPDQGAGRQQPETRRPALRLLQHPARLGGIDAALEDDPELYSASGNGFDLETKFGLNQPAFLRANNAQYFHSTPAPADISMGYGPANRTMWRTSSATTPSNHCISSTWRGDSRHWGCPMREPPNFTATTAATSSPSVF